MWTINRVKDVLPAVQVYRTADRTTYAGTIAGRCLPYASVTLWSEDRQPVATYEYSWAQLTGALNAGRPLIA